MQYRSLGRTGLSVSTVGMGCWAIVGDETWGPQDAEDSLNAIRAALDAGINFFDTAEGYGGGYSEELLARALEGRRDKALLATKVSSGELTVTGIRQSCEASLRRLRTEYVDLYQIHWPNRSIPIEESLQALVALREEGKIRAYGVSNFGKQDLTSLLANGRVESNQLSYSLLWRAIEFELQPICVEHALSLLCYSPLCQGLLTGKFRSPEEVPEGRARTRLFSKSRPQARHSEPGCEAETFEALEQIRKISESIGHPMHEVAMAWLLKQPGVATVIAGSRNAKQSQANARAADLDLSEDLLRQLSQATQVVKERIGANVDMWQTESRIQ